jgi:hypothetical protein
MHFFKSPSIAFICFVFLLGLSINSCVKDFSGNGSLKVKFTHSGTSVGQAIVYLNKDSVYLPTGPNDEYDHSLSADAEGVVSFANLEAGKYFVYASGFSRNRTVEGVDSIIIRRRFRQNDYDLIVKAQEK